MSTNGQLRLTIDGREVTVPPDTVIVEAAKRAGIEIPVFCYHPKLEPVGMCRMCLVEAGTPRRTKDGQIELDAEGQPVIAWMPRLITACNTPVSEGMMVKTDSTLATAGQRATIEFLLTSHPLDCPVCDKGGECPLQELTIKHGPGKSRFLINEKFHFEKPVPVGPLIYLDRERCILCARCTRFQDEIAGHPVLGFMNRGRGMEVVSFSDPPFNSKFSGNTIDICPVGALTSRDFRFQARVWELTNVDSVCTHCPVGCNITLGTRLGRIRRIVPRENEAVNEIWICDKGRFAHHFLISEERLTAPLVRKDGKLVETTWEEAIQTVSRRLAEIKAQKGAQSLAGIGSVRTTNEENYLFQKFMRTVLGTNNVDHRLDGGWDAGPEIAATGKISDLEKVETILVIGTDPSEEVPVLELRVKKAVRRGAKLIVANPYKIELAAQAKEWIVHKPGTEAVLLAGILNLVLAEGVGGQEMKDTPAYSDLGRSLALYSAKRVAEASGVAAESLQRIVQIIAQTKNLAIIYGERVANLKEVISALVNLALVKGDTYLYPVARGANAQGAKDMRVLPSEPSLDTRGIMEAAAQGRIAGLYIMGADVLSHFPHRQLAEEALDKVDFLVVQDLFLTETTKKADVVLPAQGFAEKDGTFTNLERRVQRLRRAVPAPEGTKSDGEIILALAKAMGQKWQYASPEAIMAEIEQVVPAYAGINYQRLEEEGIIWDYPPKETSLLSMPQDLLQTPSDEEYPFLLIPAPRLFDGGTMVRETDLLDAFVPRPAAGFNQKDFERLGLSAREEVILVSPLGRLELAARVAEVREGSVLVWQNLSGAPVNLLTAADGPIQVRVEKIGNGRG